MKIALCGFVLISTFEFVVKNAMALFTQNNPIFNHVSIVYKMGEVLEMMCLQIVFVLTYNTFIIA
jgi:hypothetical protein